MDTINTLELKDESTYPDDNVLRSVLDDSYDAYLKMMDLFAQYEMHHEWRYYKDGKAWLCKVQKKKKTIVWMSAWKGYMQAAIYFPVRLLDEVLELDISESSREKLLGTKNVGKSRPFIFEIRTDDVLVDFEKVVAWKIKSK